MIININIKQLSKRGRRVKPVPFEYNEPFETVEGFIRATVRIMYNIFKAKESGKADTEAGVDSFTKVLSEEEIEDMAEAGKIAFDLIYGNKNISLETAEDTALSAYKDGLVRLFVGEEEAGEPESPLKLKDGDEVTFIRLTFLAGRIW